MRVRDVILIVLSGVGLILATTAKAGPRLRIDALALLRADRAVGPTRLAGDEGGRVRAFQRYSVAPSPQSGRVSADASDLLRAETPAPAWFGVGAAEPLRAEAGYRFERDETPHDSERKLLPRMDSLGDAGMRSHGPGGPLTAMLTLTLEGLSEQADARIGIDGGIAGALWRMRDDDD